MSHKVSETWSNNTDKQLYNSHESEDEGNIDTGEELGW